MIRSSRLTQPLNRAERPDAEIEALSIIMNAIDGLTHRAKTRIAKWLVAKVRSQQGAVVERRKAR